MKVKQNIVKSHGNTDENGTKTQNYNIFSRTQQNHEVDARNPWPVVCYENQTNVKMSNNSTYLQWGVEMMDFKKEWINKYMNE